jgi:hypothetical protein
MHTDYSEDYHEMDEPPRLYIPPKATCESAHLASPTSAMEAPYIQSAIPVETVEEKLERSLPSHATTTLDPSTDSAVQAIRASMTLLLVLMTIVVVLVVVGLASSKSTFGVLITVLLLVLMAWFVGFTWFVKADVLARHCGMGVFLVDAAWEAVKRELADIQEDWKHRKALLLLTYEGDSVDNNEHVCTDEHTDNKAETLQDYTPPESAESSKPRKKRGAKSKLFQFIVQPLFTRQQGTKKRKGFFRRNKQEKVSPLDEAV